MPDRKEDKFGGQAKGQLLCMSQVFDKTTAPSMNGSAAHTNEDRRLSYELSKFNTPNKHVNINDQLNHVFKVNQSISVISQNIEATPQQVSAKRNRHALRRRVQHDTYANCVKMSFAKDQEKEQFLVSPKSRVQKVQDFCKNSLSDNLLAIND